MSKGAGDSPEPDPQIGAAALKSAQLGEDWLSFSKDAFAVSQERQAELDTLTKQLTNQQLEIGQTALDQSKADRARYEQVFRPIEDQYVETAKNYASEDRQSAAAAEAGADVQTAAANARGATERQAEAMGLDPRSGRFAAMQDGVETNTALAEAGAKNNAREQVRAKGLALQEGLVNMGKGLESTSAQQAALALSSGGSAQGLNLNANTANTQSLGIMGSGYNGAQAGYSTQAGILNNLFNAKNTAYQNKVQEQSSLWSGIGSAVGMGAGLIFSDEDLKEDKEPIPEGQALEAIENMPVESWSYKDGVADGGEHVGTYAQDWQRETGKGDGHTINLQDAVGLTMRAIQDLDAKIDKVAGAMGLGMDVDKPASAPVRRKPGTPSNDNVAEQPTGLGLKQKVM